MPATRCVFDTYVSLECLRVLGAHGGRGYSALSRINTKMMLFYHSHQRFGPSTEHERPRTEAVRMLTIAHTIARTSPSTLGDGAGSWRANGKMKPETPHRMRKRRQGTRDAAASFWTAGEAESASVTSHEAQAGWPRCRARRPPAGASVHTCESTTETRESVSLHFLSE